MNKKKIYVKGENDSIYVATVSDVMKLTQTERHEVLNKVMNDELVMETCLVPPGITK